MTHTTKQQHGEAHLAGKLATRYTLFLPLNHNDSRLMPAETLYQAQRRILYYAGGLTRLAQAKGLWVSPAGQVAEDTILPIQVVVPTSTEAHNWFTHLAAELAVAMAQQAIFLVAQPLVMVKR